MQAAPAAAAARPEAPARRHGRPERNPFPDIFAGRRRRDLFLLIAAGFGQGGVFAAISMLMKSAFDAYASDAPGSDDRALSIFGALAACGVAAGLLKWFAQIEAERIGQSYAHALRMRLFRRLVEAGGSRQSRRGAVLLRLTGDMTPIRQWVSLGLSQLIVSLLTIALSLAALAAIDWRIAAAVSAVLALGAGVSIVLSWRLAEATASARSSRGRMANAAGDNIANPAAGPADGRKARRKLRKLSRQVRDSLMERAYHAGAIRAVATGVGAMAGIAALGVGLAAPSGEPLSAGAVMSAIFIAGVVAPYAHDASRSLEYWTAAKIAREKQLELFRRLSKGEKIADDEASSADNDVD